MKLVQYFQIFFREKFPSPVEMFSTGKSLQEKDATFSFFFENDIHVVCLLYLLFE